MSVAAMAHLILLTLCSALLAFSTGAELAAPVSPRDAEDSHRRTAASVPGFFALGDDALAWDDDVLTRVLAPTVPRRQRARAEAELFAHAGTLANHLGLRPIDGVVLPQSVHVLLVGFDGDGHRNVSVSESELRRWVEHGDTVIPHARRSDSTTPPPTSAGGRGALFSGESYVSWNVSLHATLVPPPVTAVIERAIALLARPHDPVAVEASTAASGAQPSGWMPDTWYHVDAGQFSALLTSLAWHLGIDTAASTTVVLLNPRKEVLPPLYGYRRGFSAPEVRLLRSEWHIHNLESAVRAHGSSSPVPTLYSIAAPSSPAARRRPWWQLGGLGHHSDNAAPKFTFRASRDWEVDSWITTANAALNDIATFNAAQSPSARVRAAAVDTLTLAAAGTAVSGEAAAAGRTLRRQLAGPVDAHVATDCVTDTFVATARVAWGDLSTGPLTWGPLTASSSAVRRSALVDSCFADHPEAAHVGTTAADEDLQVDLETLAAQHYSTDQDGVLDDMQMLETELDVYEAFAHKHCANTPIPPPLCAELRLRVAELEQELDQLVQEQQQFEPTGDATARVSPKARPHRWSIFDGDVVAAPRARAARDRFLTELVALLHVALRHVAVPVVSAGAFRYHDVIRVNVYDVTWGGDGPAAGAAPARVDTNALESELRALLLPDQTLQLTITPLRAGDDPALGAALSAAARSAATSDVHGSRRSNSTHDGRFATSAGGVHRYLDPWELHRQLSTLSASSSSPLGRLLRGKGRPGVPAAAADRSHSPTSDVSDPTSSRALVVPVFVITSLGGPPLYVDPVGKETALSLGDMVVAVVSPHRAVPAPAGFVCGGPQAGALRVDHSDGTTAAVRAVASHLGGARSTCDGPHADSDDCTWSTGIHALASTGASGAGGAPSGTVTDVLGRSYVATCMDASLDDANVGIDALQRVRTSGLNPDEADDDHDADDVAIWRAYRSARANVARLLAEWRSAVGAWHATAQSSIKLDWAAAVKHCREAEASAHAFRLQAQALAAQMRPHHCMAPSSSTLLFSRVRRILPDAWPLIALGVAAAIAIGASCMRSMARPRLSSKPKLN